MKNLRRHFTIGARDMIKAVAFALVVAFIIKSSIVEAYGIPSGSMEDTLLIGDLIVSNKVIYGAKVPFTDYRLPAIRSPRRSVCPSSSVTVFQGPR